MLDLACDECFYIKLKMAVNCCHMTPVLVKKLPDICQFCCQHLLVAMFCVSVKLSDVSVAMTPVLLNYHASSLKLPVIF